MKNINLCLNERGASALAEEIDLHLSHLRELDGLFDEQANEKILSRMKVLELIRDELRRQLTQ